jgi:hypothetical protein
MAAVVWRRPAFRADFFHPAAGLRVNLFRKKIINRISAYPDLDCGRPAGSRDVGEEGRTSTSTSKPVNPDAMDTLNES